MSKSNIIIPVGHVHTLFPVLVVRLENAVAPGLCNRFLSYILRFKTGASYKHHCISGSSVSNYMTDSDIIKELDREIVYGSRLQDLLNDYVARYRTYYGMKPGVITNSWFNIQNRGSSLKHHLHPNSEISGALYINVDEDSSPIVFHTPNPHIMNSTYERESDFTKDNISFIPKIGDLFLFPSWLLHSSNYVDNQTLNRCVISFNS